MVVVSFLGCVYARRLQTAEGTYRITKYAVWFGSG